jgi:ATP-dependent RNA helicase RhlE
LPILQILSKGTPAKSNQVRTLILTPTRELAAQDRPNFEKPMGLYS